MGIYFGGQKHQLFAGDAAACDVLIKTAYDFLNSLQLMDSNDMILTDANGVYLLASKG